MLINDAHIWLARFDSDERLEEYMEEEYGEEDDETPISEFAKDQGEWFYDHDLVYAEYEESAGLRELLDGWEFPAASVEQIVQAATEQGITGANTSFVADKDEFSAPKSARGDGYELWYVGQFDGCSR